MENNNYKSYIVGQAQVFFGGGVNVSLGTVGNNHEAFAIGLSELKQPASKAGEIPPSADTFGIQVSLVFPDLATLKNFRNILDDLEFNLKEKIKNESSAQRKSLKAQMEENKP